MIRNISIGIDVGTSTTKVVVGEFLRGEKFPKVIGIGEAETKGVRHGYITNAALAVSSVEQAVKMAEKTSGIKVRRAFVSVGGTTLRAEVSSGSTVISKADSEVTMLDVRKALEEAESNLNLNNKKVIKSFPLTYRLDGKEVLGRLEGMRGIKLEVKGLFVTYAAAHLEDLLEVIALAGVETIDIIPAPIAASYIALSEKQKIVGSALVNIGSETTSLAVFENDALVSLNVFSIGSTDITNDIALGLKIPLEKAENFKLGGITEDYSKRKFDEIVDARLSDIFELIENQLKKIKRSELLPAGIIFIGGGANTERLEELSRDTLRLPTRIGSSEIFGNMKTKLRDTSWFTALGLVTAGEHDSDYTEGSFANVFKDFKNKLKSGAKQLMP